MTIPVVGETPVERWQRLHPGVNIERWATAMAAAQDVQSDWAYRHCRYPMPERYSGLHGWWL